MVDSWQTVFRNFESVGNTRLPVREFDVVGLIEGID